MLKAFLDAPYLVSVGVVGDLFAVWTANDDGAGRKGLAWVTSFLFGWLSGGGWLMEKSSNALSSCYFVREVELQDEDGYTGDGGNFFGS